MVARPIPLSKKLQQLRQARGLTQQKLANDAQVSLSTVSKLEEGAVTRPSARILLKLVKVLNFELDELLNEQPLPAELIKASKPVVPKKTIKFIYFDIGGVLVHTEASLLQSLSMLYKRPIDKIRALYYQYVPIACRGQLSLEDLQLLYLLKLNIKYKHNQKAALFKHWVDYFEPIPASHQFLTELAKKYPVGLLTDTIDGFVERMQKRELVPKLGYKAIIKSSDVGITKPDPQIYKLAIEAAKVKPEEILFIDDKKLNVEAAREAGWKAEWFDEMDPEGSVAHIKRLYF